MTLDELLQHCRQEPSVIPNYIAKYKIIREQRIAEILALKFKDLGMAECYSDILPPRTKGVIVGLVIQKLLEVDKKLMKIDAILDKLKRYKVGIYD